MNIYGLELDGGAALPETGMLSKVQTRVSQITTNTLTLVSLVQQSSSRSQEVPASMGLQPTKKTVSHIVPGDFGKETYYQRRLP